MRLAVFVAILQCVVNANEIVLSPTLQYFTIAPPLRRFVLFNVCLIQFSE